MNETDAANMINRYSRSYYHEDSASGWFEANESAKRSGYREGRIDARAIGGSKVPIARGRDLVNAMLENVEDSRRAVEATGKRLERARVDGLLDKEAFASLSKKSKAAWLACVQVVKGDYHRARAELKQWQEYAELASKGEFPTLSRPGGFDEIVKQLAEAKSDPQQDPRLPPERDDDEVAF